SDAGRRAGDGDDTGHQDSVVRGLVEDPVAELAFRGVDVGAIAAGVDEGLHRVLRCAAVRELAVAAPVPRRARDPDIDGKTSKHLEAALEIGVLLRIPDASRPGQRAGA